MRRLWVTMAMASAVSGPALAGVDLYLGAGAGGVRVESSDATGASDIVETKGATTYPYHYETRDFQGGDVGYRGFVGARIGRYFALEGGYADLGHPERDTGYVIPPGPTVILPEGTPYNPNDLQEILLQSNPKQIVGRHTCIEAPLPTGDCPRPRQNDLLLAQMHIRGFEGYAIGRFPLTEKWELFGKVGVFAWRNTYTVRDKIAELQTKTLPPGILPITITPSSPVSTDGVDLAAGLGMNYHMGKHFTLRGEGTWYDVKNTSQAWMIGFDVIYGFAL
jgi:hypothetical protein